MGATAWLRGMNPACAHAPSLSVAESIALIRTGTWSRVGFSALCVVIAAQFAPPPFLATWSVALVVWEFLVRPTLETRFVTPAAARDEAAGYRLLAATHLVGAIAYCLFPLVLWSTGGATGALLAVGWVCATAAHLFVYFSGSRVLLAANLTPLAAVCVAAPFLGAANLSPPALAGVALLIALVTVGGLAGYDRKGLLAAVTASAAARQAAEDTALAKSRFLGLASHELRTPLHAIIGYAEIICEAKDAHADDAGRILTAAQRLLGIVDEMLEVSRLEAGLVALERTPSPAIALVEMLHERGAKLAEANGNRFAVRVWGTLGEANLDWARLERATMHLVENAAKFTRGGAIEVTVARDRGVLSIAVRDTGDGVAPERLAEIFSPLAQADGSAARRYEGAGMGLAYARLVARLMGGDVTCESRAGVGSTFTLSVRAD